MVNSFSIEDELGKDYREALVDSIRETYGFEGNCRFTDEPMPQTGTSVRKGGFFRKVKATFPHDKLVLIYKKGKKMDISMADLSRADSIYSESEIGAMVAEELQRLSIEHGDDFGFDWFYFVPTRIVPKGTNKEGRDWSEVRRERNIGEFFVFEEGGTIEEIVRGESPLVDPTNTAFENVPVDALMEYMMRVYTLTSVLMEDGKIGEDSHLFPDRKYLFHKQLLKKIRSYSLESAQEFADELDNAHSRLFRESNMPLTLTHGSLMQGNYLISSNTLFGLCSNYNDLILDWDTANWDYAHNDFARLFIRADLVQNKTLTRKLDEAFFKLSTVHPGINAAHISFILGEHYLSNLVHYHSTLGSKDQETAQNMRLGLKHCETASLREFGRLKSSGQNSGLITSAYFFYTDAFADLTNVSYQPRGSVAYLHTTDRGLLKGGLTEEAEENMNGKKQK